MCCTQCSAAVLQSYETQQNTMQCVECVEHSFECSAPVLQRYETLCDAWQWSVLSRVLSVLLPPPRYRLLCSTLRVLQPPNHTQLWEYNIVLLVGEYCVMSVCVRVCVR